MLKFNLKSLLDEYESKTGLKITYGELSELVGVSPDTIKSLNRPDYNATLSVISKIGAVLGLNPINYLSWHPDKVKDGE